MASTINSDNGAVSGSAGLKTGADSSGVLALQTNGTTAVTVGTDQNTTFNTTGAVTLPVGTTAQRPGTPVNGMMRVNTTANTLEVYSTNNSSWNTVSSFINPPTSIDILVVAGGGTGGLITANRGAGGGAGGLVYITSFPVATGNYTVTVGSGGASSSGTAVASGSNSVFTGNGRTLTSLGGGSGGFNDGTNNGATGGSGGGQWYPGYAGAAATQPSTTNDGISTYTTSGFGNAGGTSGSSQPYASGGGGAGAAGGNFNAGGGPVGGIGKAYTISGTSTYYAGGGGGAGYPPAGGYVEYAGGLGGGGTGANDAYDTISNGTANTGGGGGSGGSGGSGVVILRYADTFGPAISVTGSPTITVAGGYRVYTFTASGSITF
jgi:hypothetical protein